MVFIIFHFYHWIDARRYFDAAPEAGLGGLRPARPRSGWLTPPFYSVDARRLRAWRLLSARRPFSDNASFLNLSFERHGHRKGFASSGF